METYIPASSPLIGLYTCSTCPAVGYYPDGLGAQSVLFAEGSISLNFTGTELQLNHTTSPAITLQYSINGSTIQPSPSSSALGQTISLTNFELSLGHHEFRIEITRPEDGLPSDTSLFHGATITSGLTPGQEAREMGIDDTAWRTGVIILTEGWNMLETPFEASNFIDTDLVQAEFETLVNDSGESISFTQRAGSAMSISFQGQAVWAYGISGDNAGSYSVQLDDRDPELFDASGGPRSYGSLLYHAPDLVAGNHTLRFTNMDNGRRFSFDRLVVVDGLISPITPPIIAPSPSTASIPLRIPSSTLPTSTTSTTVSLPTNMPDQDRSHLSGAAITGVVVGVMGPVTVLAFLGWWFFAQWRKANAQGRNQDRDRDRDHARALAQEKKRITFFRFSDSHKSGDRKTFNRLHSPLGTGTGASTDFSKRRSKYRSNPFGITGFRFPGLRANPDHLNQQQQSRMHSESPLRQIDTKEHEHEHEHEREHKRQRSFLDMDLEVEAETEHQHHGIPGLKCLTSPRPLSIGGERRILPIHHGNIGGESPLAELVRYSPHTPHTPYAPHNQHESTYSQPSYVHPSGHEPGHGLGHELGLGHGRDQSYMETFGHRTQLSNSGSGRTGMTAGSGWILGPSQTGIPPVPAPAAAAAAAGSTGYPWPRPSGPGGAL